MPTIHIRTSCFVQLLLACLATAAGSDKLDLSNRLAFWGGNCNETPGFILAGTQYSLRLTNGSNPLSNREYGIQAMLNYLPGIQFESDLTLAQAIGARPYDNPANMLDSIDNGLPSASYVFMLAKAKTFVVTIPNQAIGNTISFRAVSLDGGTESVSNITSPIQVIAPCSKEDTAKVLGSFVHQEYRASNWNRAVEIADSLQRNGIVDASMFLFAWRSAVSIGDHASALRFLDALFNYYGILSLDPMSSAYASLSRCAEMKIQNRLKYLEYREEILTQMNRK